MSLKKKLTDPKPLNGSVYKQFFKSEYENIETLSLSADYYRCQCLHLTAIRCLLFLLHIYIKSNISQLLDTLTASSDLLSIPQSPVRVCLSAPIDIINWRDLLISVHSAPVDTYGDGLNVSCLWRVALLQSSKAIRWNNSARRLLTNYKQFYCACDAYVFVCLWMTCLNAARGSTFCELTLRRGLCRR